VLCGSREGMGELGGTRGDSGVGSPRSENPRMGRADGWGRAPLEGFGPEQLWRVFVEGELRVRRRGGGGERGFFEGCFGSYEVWLW
jgi:hypothetical protein